MLPDRVSNPGPLTHESGALPIALRGPAHKSEKHKIITEEEYENAKQLHDFGRPRFKVSTVDSRYLDFGYLELPLISKGKSYPCLNI